MTKNSLAYKCFLPIITEIILFKLFVTKLPLLMIMIKMSIYIKLIDLIH